MDMSASWKPKSGFMGREVGLWWNSFQVCFREEPSAEVAVLEDFISEYLV